MKKRILCVLLALCMVLALVPATAMAAPAPEDPQYGIQLATNQLHRGDEFDFVFKYAPITDTDFAGIDFSVTFDQTMFEVIKKTPDNANERVGYPVLAMPDPEAEVMKACIKADNANKLGRLTYSMVSSYGDQIYDLDEGGYYKVHMRVKEDAPYGLKTNAFYFDTARLDRPDKATLVASITDNRLAPNVTEGYNWKQDITILAPEYKVLVTDGTASLGDTGNTITMAPEGATVKLHGVNPDPEYKRFSTWRVDVGGMTITNPHTEDGASFVMPGRAAAVAAEYTHITLNITFDVNGGSGYIPDDSHFKGNTVTVPTVEQFNAAGDVTPPTDKAFGGWTISDPDGSNPEFFGPGESFTIMKDCKATLTWIGIPTDVTYHYHNGTADKTISVEKGTELAVPSAESVESSGMTIPQYKTFGGYKIDGTTYAPGSTVTVNAPIVVDYIWNAIPVKVTVDLAGATMKDTSLTGFPDINLNKGDKLTVPSATEVKALVNIPNKKIYAGVKLGDGTVLAPGTQVPVLEDTAVSLAWADDLVTVTLNFNGGTTTNPASKKVIRGTVLNVNDLLSGVTAPQYHEFDALAAGGTEYGKGETITADGDLTVLYKWKHIYYTITSDLNGASGSIATEQIKAGSTLTIPTYEDLKGYGITAPAGKKYAGVQVDGTTYTAGQTITVLKNITIKYLWTDDLVTVNYDFAGGTTANPNSADVIRGTVLQVNDIINGVTAPQYRRFKELKVGSTSYKAGASITAADNINVVFVWEPIPCVMTIDVNGATLKGTMIPDKTVDAGTWVIVPTADQVKMVMTAPAGKKYQGVKVGTKTYLPNQKILIESDITVKFLWEDDLVNVTLDANGGTLLPHVDPVETFPRNVPSFTVWNSIPEDIITAPEGKRYLGVEIDGTKYAPGDVITFTKDCTMKFVWERISLTLTHDANGGKIRKSAEDDWKDTLVVTFPNHAKLIMDEFDPKLMQAPVDKEFVGVEIDGEVYKPGDQIILHDKDYTCKWIWKKATDRIFDIQLEVVAPKKDAKPDTHVGLPVDANYSVREVKWTPADDPFKPVTAYTVEINVLYADGMMTAQSEENRNYTINGKKATVVEDYREGIVLSLTFDKTADEEPSEVPSEKPSEKPSTPDTGVKSSAIWWTLLAILSVCGAACAVLFAKKRKATK